MKTCTKCNLQKEIIEFHKKSKSKDGHHTICKSCSSNYRKSHYNKNRQKVIKQNRAYQERNKEIDWKERRLLIEVNCKYCNNKFKAPDSYYKKGRYQCCSRSCSAKIKHNPIDRIVKDIKKRAKVKNLDFNLSTKFLEDLLEKQKFKCALSKCPIEIPRMSEVTSLYKSASLDRIENTKGYIEGNVQWVVLGVNYMKNRFTDKDVIKLLELIKTHIS